MLPKSVKTAPDRSLIRFFTVVLPQVSRELSRWQQHAIHAEWPLSQQAWAGISRRRFRIQKGCFYALYNFNPHYEKKLVALLVALQTIGGYLGNLCECGGAYSEAAFRYLYLAIPAALTRGPMREQDYYRFYPAKCDGGYLKALVRECRTCVAALPGYPEVEREILKFATLYSDLQIYSRLHPGARSSRLKRWFREKAAPVTPSLHWWEYAAACASPLALFALFGLATSPQSGGQERRELVKAYFPWVCGLHILLENWVELGADIRGDAFNFAACYRSPAMVGERLSLFLRKALQKISTLPHASFHRSVVQGLLALYLSDFRAERRDYQKIASELLWDGGRGAQYSYRLCRWLRRLGVLD